MSVLQKIFHIDIAIIINIIRKIELPYLYLAYSQ